MTDTPDESMDGLLEGLREAVAWKRGALALETVEVDPMPAERVKPTRTRWNVSRQDECAPNSRRPTLTRVGRADSR